MVAYNNIATEYKWSYLPLFLHNIEMLGVAWTRAIGTHRVFISWQRCQENVKLLFERAAMPKLSGGFICSLTPLTAQHRRRSGIIWWSLMYLVHPYWKSSSYTSGTIRVWWSELDCRFINSNSYCLCRHSKKCEMLGYYNQVPVVSFHLLTCGHSLHLNTVFPNCSHSIERRKPTN